MRSAVGCVVATAASWDEQRLLSVQVAHAGHAHGGEGRGHQRESGCLGIAEDKHKVDTRER
eukprot:16761-Pleurochrysis_carterae.AAC.1